MAGRPPKYESVERWELSPKVEKSDKFGFDDFQSEDDLCDYIDVNANLFARDILESEYVEHEREWDLNQFRYFGPRSTRVDFMFKTDSSDCVLVECKNPTSIYSEIRNAISQLMAYRIVCIENGICPDRCLIVTTKYHPIIGKMLDEYELPFELYVLGKNQIMKLKELSN